MPGLIDLVRNNQYMSTLDTSRNVKPEKPKGYLVNTPIYKAPFVYMQDLAHDTYGIIKGWNGKANDHELGKQNDIGMKVGGLAIAAYLATKRPSKLPKLMEFVGAGSFFASLALWPKLAIALPLKLRTGVDIQQQYVDSYGRKKKFFQDPQYLPWDLYNKEQILKMGDKMGVPYDVPNRDEVIKEKARKLAVQGNTLWLATAGFATPIMTSLICKGLEPTVNNLKQKYDLKKTQKILDGEVGLPSAKKQTKAFEAFLTENIGKKINTNELIEKMNWSPVVSPNMPDVLKKDLAKILENVPNEITKEYADNICSGLSDALTKAGISKEEVVNAFENNHIFGSQTKLFERYRAYNPTTSALDLQEATAEVLEKLVDGKKLSFNLSEEVKREMLGNNLANIVREHNRKVLDEKTAEQLKGVYGVLSDYFRKETVLKKWENVHYAPNADSIGAYSWKKGSDAVLSVLDLSPKEIEIMKKEGSEPAILLEKKLAEIAADPVRYKKTVTKIADAIAEYDMALDETARSKYRGFVDRMSGSAKEGLEKLGFKSTARYIGGGEILKDGSNINEALNGSLRRLRHIEFDERVLSQKASMYRFIQVLDLHKRLHDFTLEAQFDQVVPESMPKLFRPKFSEVAKRAKDAIMDASLADHSAKLGGKGKNTYKAVMRLLYGALPDDYVKDSIVNLSSDVKGVRNRLWTALEDGLENGYRAAINEGLDKVQLNRFRTGLTKETIEALYEASERAVKKSGVNDTFNNFNLVDNFKKYFQTFIEKVVNAKSDLVNGFDLAEHNVKGAIEGLQDSMSPSLKASLIGSKPVEIVRAAAKDAASSSKWLRKFGIAGAVLLAGTVLATTMFGHVPEKEMYMRENNDGTTNKKAK